MSEKDFSSKNSETPSMNTSGQSFNDSTEHESGEDPVFGGNTEDMTREEVLTRDLPQDANSEHAAYSFQSQESESLRAEFSAFREEVGKSCEVIVDRDVDSKEIFVKNPTRMFLKDSGTKSSKSMVLPKGTETCADAEFSDYTSHTSEAELLNIKSTRNQNISRYEQNFQKFMEYVNSQNNRGSLEKAGYKSKRNKDYFKRTIKSDGTASNIRYCADIRRITNILKKVTKISNSAPASFSNSTSDDLSIHKFPSEKAECQTATLQTFEAQDTCQELKKDEALEKSDVDEELSVSADSLQCASYLPKLPLTFKVPVLPKTSGKLPKSQVKLSPQGASNTAAETSEKSPLCSPRRPADLNISPRRSFYMFSPESPGLLRQYHSLPDISRPPKKELKWSSINIGNLKYGSSVKALFTNQPKFGSLTPESSMSSIEIKDIETDLSDSPIEIESSHSNERSSLSVSERPIKCKIRKNLINIFNVCGKKASTSQESNMSSEVSSIASHHVTDSTKETSAEISVGKSSPKRKHSSPDLPVEVTSTNNPKKLRLCETLKSNEEKTTGPDITEGHTDSDLGIVKCVDSTESAITSFEPEPINAASQYVGDSVEQFKDEISESEQSAEDSQLASLDEMDIVATSSEVETENEFET